MTKLTRCEELKKKLVEADEAFNQMLAEVKAETQDRDEQNQLLTARVLEAFIRSFSKNKGQLSASFGPIPKKKRGHPCEKTQEVIKKRRISPVSTTNCYNEKVISPCASPSPSPSARNSSYRKRRKDEDEFFKYYYDEDEKPQLRESKKRKTSPEINSNQGNNNKKGKTPLLSIPNPPVPMPLEVHNKIESLGGYQVILVTHKQLFKTDLSSTHDRLSFTYNQVVNKDFLGEKYEKKLRNDQVIPVKVIDMCLKEHELGMKRWNSKNSYSYAINRGWNSISLDANNQLKENDILQVWSFRVKDPDFLKEQICFALVKLKLQDQGEEDTISADNECNDSSVKVVDSSSITIKDELKKEDMKSDRHEMIDVVESSLITKKNEGSNISASASANQEVTESAATKMRQPEIGATEHYVMNLKYSNVMVAKIETGVPIV